MTSPPLLEAVGLTVEYARGQRRAPLRAVDDVSFALAAGQTVGLVGESGSGKTTIGRAILGLAPISSGAIYLEGSPISHAAHRDRRALSSQLQVVFQDPYSSLSPTRTIGQTLAETLRVHDKRAANEIDEAVAATLDQVGLPTDAARRYPAHFSGGQRQRIAIARALIARPRIVICDEPTSALDLSVQGQVLNLLQDLQDELGLSYLFISHDLAVVRHISHRIIVLYRGRTMEEGNARTIYGSPVHPYTRALLEAAPVPDPAEQRRRRQARRQTYVKEALRGESEHGCPFVARCPYAIDRCTTERPQLEPSATGALVACHRGAELAQEYRVAQPLDTPFDPQSVQRVTEG